MKTLIVLMVLSGSICRADKESAKGRLDDCFRDASSLMNQASEEQRQDPDGGKWPQINRRFLDKKKQCFDLKTPYEKSYGKYTLPKM